MRYVLAVAVIALACGCLCSPAQEEAAPPSTTLKVRLESGNLSGRGNTTNKTVVVLDSVGEALFMWSPFYCNYSNPIRIGESTFTQVWMDAGKYHAVTSREKGGKSHVINDGINVYMWFDDVPAPGNRYKISQITGLREHIDKAEIKGNRSVAIPTEYLDFVGAKNVTCREAVLPNGSFVPQKKTFNEGQGVYDYDYDSKLDKYSKN